MWENNYYTPSKRDRYFYLRTYTHEVYAARGDTLTLVARFNDEEPARAYVRSMNS